MSQAARIAILSLSAALLAGCGSTPPSPLPAPTESSAPPPPPTGISRDRAIEIARAAVPLYSDEDVLSADVLPWIDAVGEYTAAHFTPAPAPDRLVWMVRLGTHCGPLCGSGTNAIIDYRDGRFLLAIDWIS